MAMTGAAHPPARGPDHRVLSRWSASAGATLATWSPIAVALVAGLAAVAFVALRLVVAADGDITRFVVAGRTFVEPGNGVHVFDSSGYDGQFYWRLAVDPGDWSRHAHGVTFDNAYRAPRIGYPLAAFVLAGGQAGLAPWALVAVNVLAVAAVAGLAGRLAAIAGRAPAYGLLVAAAPGLVMPLGRDLAECLTVACLLGGVVALCGRRPLVATCLWSYAVLTREQALVTIAAYAIWRAAPPVRRLVTGTGDHRSGDHRSGDHRSGDDTAGTDRPPALADLAWLVPGLVFVGWQAVLWRSTGDLPAASAGDSNLVPPFSALAPGLVDWATGGLPRLHVAAPLQLATVVAGVAAAARRVRAVPADLGYTAVAAALATLAATCLAASIWRDPSDMRHLVDVSTWSTVVVVVARRAPPHWFVALVSITWVATAAVRVLAP